MNCEKCDRRFQKYSTRISFKPVTKHVNNHVHSGLPDIRYGICSKKHYTAVDTVTINWSPCFKCEKDKGMLRPRSKSVRKKLRKRKSRKKKDSIYSSPPPPPPYWNCKE